MPLSDTRDRERSRNRRNRDQRYNDVQRAARVRRDSNRARRPSHSVRFCCARRRPFPLFSSVIKENGTRSDPWWVKFGRSMKRSRWRAPTWRRSCDKCGAHLLDGEDRSFCCNNGKWIAPPLPPLPTNLTNVVNNSPTKTELSSRSRALNNLFCFTAIGSTQGFQRFDTGPASVAITGRTYHRVFDAADRSQALNWFLYDSQERERHGTQYNVPNDWRVALNDDLQIVNRYVHDLRRFSTVPTPTPCALELSDVGQNGDFAAIMHAANSTSIKPRSIVVWRNRDAEPTFMPIYSRHYEPMQYPLRFPHGTPGWGLTTTASGGYKNTLSLTQRVWYRSRLLTDNRFLIFGRLTCEYVCDMYSRIEEERLNFIRRSKETLAREFADDIEQDNDEQANITLPASFMGSRMWASEQTADSLALARTYGPPSLFITMTCNPDWPEIKTALLPGQQACDAPVVVARAFKNRLQRLFHILRNKLGHITYMTSSNEFQKRGLPHSHIVLQVIHCCTHNPLQFTCYEGSAGTTSSRNRPRCESTASDRQSSTPEQDSKVHDAQPRPPNERN